MQYQEVMSTEYGVLGTYYTKDRKGFYTVPVKHELAMLDSKGENNRGYFSGSLAFLRRALTLSTVIKRARNIAP